MRALVSASWTIRSAWRPIASGTAARSPRRTSACRSIPAARDSSSNPGSAASVGWGGCGASPSAPVAQHADHGAQVLERLVGAGADHSSGTRDLLGRGVRAKLQRAGVQAQQRDPVGQHVVHLARDARALGVADLLDAQLLLGLGVT